MNISQEISGVEMPSSVVDASSNIQPERKRAGLGARSLALAIDYMVLEFFLFLALFPMKNRLSEMNFGMDLLGGALEVEKLSGVIMLYLCMFFATLAFWGFYFTFFHWTSGQTLGKYILGIKVVRLDGSLPGPGGAFVRCIGFMFGLSLFGLGLLWAVFDKDGRAWHDKIAGTIVVKGD
ncbi:MAG: RDD family protein [Nitrospinae bacterium]|nr:RDD family protein [Nitrospinota bacterium]